MTAELECLCQFEEKLNDLLEQDIYIARSDYKDLRDENESIFSFTGRLAKTLIFPETSKQIYRIP